MADELIWSMQNRRDTASNWTNNDPILLDGQIGIESDTKKIKIGTGINWNDTDYFASGAAIEFVDIQGAASDNASLVDFVNSSIPQVLYSQSINSSATPVPIVNADLNVYRVVALSQNAVFQNPNGTQFIDGELLFIEIINSTSTEVYNISFTSKYKFNSGVPAPSTSSLNKSLFLKFIYRFNGDFWDCILNTAATSGGAAALTENYIGVGDSSNQLSGTDRFQFFNFDPDNHAYGLYINQASPDANNFLVGHYNVLGGITVFNAPTGNVVFRIANGSDLLSTNGSVGFWNARKVSIGGAATPAETLDVLGTLRSVNQYSSSPAPSIAAGAGAGTSPTISIAGTNDCIIITLTTGTSPVAGATIATITFSGSFAFPNGCIAFPVGGDSATLLTSSVLNMYADESTTGFDLKMVSGVALFASKAYKIKISVKGY